jgi:hypothetical protein
VLLADEGRDIDFESATPEHEKKEEEKKSARWQICDNWVDIKSRVLFNFVRNPLVVGTSVCVIITD